MNYLHPHSQTLLDYYLANPSQSVLIAGEEGIGFKGAIDYIATSFGVSPIMRQPEKDGKIDLEKGSITAEMIRDLYERTSLRSRTKQLIVIDGAETMSAAAQNAFLKLLEEPSPSVYFILLSHEPQKLLATVRSRLSDIVLTPITTEQSHRLFEELGVSDATKRQQLLFIADGRPALLTRLAQNNDLFITRGQVMRDARTMIQGTHYEALKVVDGYKTRESAQLLLKDMSRLLQLSITNTNARQVVARLQTLLAALEAIEQNGNPRLWLTQSVV